MLLRFDLGTHYKLWPEYRLARGNPQWPSVLDLFRKHIISWSNFLLDLKAQSRHGDNQRPVRMFT